VATVAVDLGDFVHEGDVLVRLEDEELRLQVQQAEAMLAQATAVIGLKPSDPLDMLDKEKSPPVRQEKSLMLEAKANLERTRQLHQQGAVPAADVEQRAALFAVAEARYLSALNSVDERIALVGVRRAELALAKEALAQARVLAPFSGFVQTRSTSPGAYVQVGDPVVTLVRSDPLRYRGSVPERHALRLQTGQEVQITVDGIAARLSARITRISPALDESNRSLTFEANVPNPDGQLRTGLFAEAEVIVDPNAVALAVPMSSVVEFAGVEKVWVVEDGMAREQPVTTGRRGHGAIEIVSGISAGALVLKQGNRGRSGPVQAAGPPSADHAGD
jgi:RND family efflux transporter MFP subunit